MDQPAQRSRCLLSQVKPFRPISLIALLVAFLVLPGVAVGSLTNIFSDSTWRVTNPAPPAGWNTSLAFDDSDAAGWEYAFQANANYNIWMRSTQSSTSPNQVWFRKVFELSAVPTAGLGDFGFDDDGEVYINGVLVLTDPGGGASSFSISLATNLFVVGQNLIAVHGIDRIAPGNHFYVDLALDIPPYKTLVATGSVWKYIDDGSDQGALWRSLTFDDSAWPSGPAQLGYGDGDEATTNNFGLDPNNKFVTTYYRRSFNVENPLAYTNLQVRFLRDDGAIVYLNGLEVFRCNMPTGAVSYLTLAQSAVPDDGMLWVPVELSPSGLRTGTNVIAVEMHQSARDSSDISFDLELIADFPNVPPWISFASGSELADGKVHFYEVVPAPAGITWDSASVAATNRGGYLATITSADENALVSGLIQARWDYWAPRSGGYSWGPWLGGVQPAGSVEPAGGWSWITGEPFLYSNWSSGEPNNNGGGENRIHFLGKFSRMGDVWNDKAASDNAVISYLVEYDRGITAAPILEFKFDETGPSAPSTGLATNVAQFLVGASTARDFHSAGGRGVSQLPGDRCFDNSGSSGMGNKGNGGRAVFPDLDAADDLLSLTLQGWFRAEGAGINDLARLIVKQAGNTGFLLVGQDGNLDLEINNVGSSSTGSRYAEANQWIFFAVTYDGSLSNNNVRFYKGTPTNRVSLLETRTLNQGRSLANSDPIVIGNYSTTGTLTRPFDGWLDDMRVFGNKTNSSGVLTLAQLEWLRSKDLQNLADPIGLSATRGGSFATLWWPLYPGGFHLETASKLTSVPAWTMVTNGFGTDGTQYFITVPATDSTRFFRLAR